MIKIIRNVLNGYGAFFGLSHPLTQALLFFATLLYPTVGLSGFNCACMVLFWRKALGFATLESNSNERTDLVNGLLLGMLIASLYAPCWQTWLAALFGALLVVLASCVVNATLGRYLQLPVLGMPYVIVSYLLLPCLSSMHLSANYSLNLALNFSLLPGGASLYQLPGAQAFCALGSMYFNGTPLGGAIVFLAFLISSRYMAILVLATAAISSYILPFFGLQVGTLSFLVAQMNAVLTAAVLGALYTVPGRLSGTVAQVAGLLACLGTVFLERLLAPVSLPPLALPFVLTTYFALLSLSVQRGGHWARLWLLTPQLPESSLAQIAISRARGIDMGSVALNLPLNGLWQVYQGIDGAETHRGQWRYAVDFFQARDDRSYSGAGDKLTDYFAYGKPVLSPCYGTVVDIMQERVDNLPGEVDTVNNWGNYILIALDTGCYVLLAHLQKSSLRVPLGARVAPGQLLALCGNSGRSPQPHLHMHVQTGVWMGAPTVPFHLCHVLKNNSDKQSQYCLNYTARTGDELMSPTRNTALKKALNLKVGHYFLYETGRDKIDKVDNAGKAFQPGYKMAVSLDLYGQFWLSLGDKNGDAHVAFSQSDDLLALYGLSPRAANKEALALLRAWTLALGLTPFVEEEISWRDLIARHHLPLPPIARAFAWLAAPCAEVVYQRIWCPQEKLWLQKGEISLAYLGGIRWRCQTEARLSEQAGLISFSLGGGAGQEALLCATLSGCSVKEDIGIPEIKVLEMQVPEKEKSCLKNR